MLSVWSYARSLRLAMPATRTLAPAPWRAKKKKAGKGSGSKKTDVDPELAAMVDLAPYEAGMQKAVEVLQNNFSRIRGGSAAPGMLDGIQVEAYGTRTALEKVAHVSVRDGRTLLVNVFDEQTTGAVEKAIRAAGLNLNPMKDGQAKLKVPIPKQTDKARESLAKMALRDAEAAKVATRMARRKAMDAVKSVKDDIGKDDLRRMENVVQQMTEKYTNTIAQSLDEKVKSINIA